MKRSIAILLGLVLATGAGLAHAGKGGGGGHGGGRGGVHGVGHVSGGRPGMVGAQFTTGSSGGFTRFTTGPHPGARPIVGIRPAPVVVGRPFPHHRVVVGGAIIVGAPYFWYPSYPYPYYYPYYPPGPEYGGGYEQAPTYIQQSDIRYYCPDYQDYYPNVANCPSQWMQVLPGSGSAN
jgi:hypothetical protein